MPDANEIAAAAERLPILEQEIADFGPVDWDIERYNAIEAKVNEVHRLRRILAAAYLAEHAEANPKHADHCRLSYDALCAILGRKHDRDYQDGDIGWESPDMGPCVVATMRDPITITGMFDGTNTVPITTCGELRAFCTLAGWHIKEQPCQHKRTRIIHEGETGQIGTVVCLDCGHEREWNAY